MSLPATLFRQTFAAVPVTRVVTSAFPRTALAALAGMLPAALGAVLPPPVPALFGGFAVPPLLTTPLGGLPFPAAFPMINPLALALPAITASVPPTVFTATFAAVPITRVAVAPAIVPGVI